MKILNADGRAGHGARTTMLTSYFMYEKGVVGSETEGRISKLIQRGRAEASGLHPAAQPKLDTSSIRHKGQRDHMRVGTDSARDVAARGPWDT